MRKITLFFIISIYCVFASVTTSFAQINGGQCTSGITAQNESYCCGENYSSNYQACDAYRAGGSVGTGTATSTQNQCSTVTTQEQNITCCGSDYATNYQACDAYRANQSIGSGSTTAGGQTTQSGGPDLTCQPITGLNESRCCDQNYSSNYQACDAYRAAKSIGEGQVGSNQNIPVNGSIYVPATTDVSSPQSGASQLSSCSAIKFKSFLDILIWVRCVITSAIIPLIFVLAFLFFLWGVLKFMYATDTKQKDEAKKSIFWGLLALFIMVSVWGIVKLLQTTFGFQAGTPYLQTQYLNTDNANK